ncbi:MAG TPA: NifB/NifX family molybdenum-iron cluster-binding protein [Ignavibacteriaceae bacterium]|nr:NifB/NifX family molybdenum-iron cluster-binding protein [Ignavibacteriaceae bacterium]
MKIAVASNDFKHVTGHLGRCKSFLIYDTENGKVIDKEVRQNTFTHHAQHGHHHGEADGHGHGEGHHHSHAALVDNLNDCNTLIFQSGGWRIIEDLKQGNIIPFLTNEKIADEAVEKYLKGELVESGENACNHH